MPLSFVWHEVGTNLNICSKQYGWHYTAHSIKLRGWHWRGWRVYKGRSPVKTNSFIIPLFFSSLSLPLSLLLLRPGPRWQWCDAAAVITPDWAATTAPFDIGPDGDLSLSLAGQRSSSADFTGMRPFPMGPLSWRGWRWECDTWDSGEIGRLSEWVRRWWRGAVVVDDHERGHWLIGRITRRQVIFILIPSARVPLRSRGFSWRVEIVQSRAVEPSRGAERSAVTVG